MLITASKQEWIVRDDISVPGQVTDVLRITADGSKPNILVEIPEATCQRRFASIPAALVADISKAFTSAAAIAAVSTAPTGTVPVATEVTPTPISAK